MFCGWSTYEVRYHLIAEGESGTYYRLAPAPWDEFRPFGDLHRHQYDYYGNGQLRMAKNTLKHTRHEPIRRIIALEECWPKKYNLPDHLWELRCGEPKDPISYFCLRKVFTGDGEPLDARPDFLTQLYTTTVFKNPRLAQDAMRGRQMFAINPYDRYMATQGARLENVDETAMESMPNAN
jgi:hypothetical protein